MTSSEDNLRWLLTRELRAEAARVSPAEDGLSQIRRRLRSRPSISLWGGLRVDAERYGYRVRYVAAEAFAWIFSLAGQMGRILPRQRVSVGRHGAASAGSGHSSASQRFGMAWLRPVLALAAVCLFAGTAMAVPGLRHTIVNIGSSSSGGTTSNGGAGGANSNGSGQQLPGGGAGGTGSKGNGNVAVTSPSASTTCSPAAKTPPNAKTTPSPSAGQPTTAVTPTAPAPSPSLTPTPSTGPTTPSPTESGAPVPTGTASLAPGKVGHTGRPRVRATDSDYTVRAKSCTGPTPPATSPSPAEPASDSASRLPAGTPAVQEPATGPGVPPTQTTTSPASTGSTAPAAGTKPAASTKPTSSASSATASGSASPQAGSSASAGASSPGAACSARRHHHHSTSC